MRRHQQPSSLADIISWLSQELTTAYRGFSASVEAHSFSKVPGFIAIGKRRRGHEPVAKTMARRTNHDVAVSDLTRGDHRQSFRTDIADIGEIDKQTRRLKENHSVEHSLQMGRALPAEGPVKSKRDSILKISTRFGALTSPAPTRFLATQNRGTIR
jgi:hypothetical protein